MKDFEVPTLLADRSRLLIMAALSLASGPMDFMTLHRALPITKGNLSAHLRKLEEGGFIEMTKEFVERKPRTTYVCTRRGRDSVRRYLKSVEELLKQV